MHRMKTHFCLGRCRFWSQASWIRLSLVQSCPGKCDACCHRPEWHAGSSTAPHHISLEEQRRRSRHQWHMSNGSHTHVDVLREQGRSSWEGRRDGRGKRTCFNPAAASSSLCWQRRWDIQASGRFKLCSETIAAITHATMPGASQCASGHQHARVAATSQVWTARNLHRAVSSPPIMCSSGALIHLSCCLSALPCVHTVRRSPLGASHPSHPDAEAISFNGLFITDGCSKFRGQDAFLVLVGCQCHCIARRSADRSIDACSWPNRKGQSGRSDERTSYLDRVVAFPDLQAPAPCC
jgi:hypothetical protein